MLKIQIVNLSGEKYDIEVSDGITVASALGELNKKYHIETSKCYLCHKMKELENSNAITGDLIKDDSKFILYNYAIFPEKSYPRVDDAFSFSSSRYSDNFVRESISSNIIINNQDDNDEQWFDENDPLTREIIIPDQGINNQAFINQLGEMLRGNQVIPSSLSRLLNMYRNLSTINNNNDYSESISEEDSNENDISNLPEFGENDNSNYEEDIYENENYNDNDNANIIYMDNDFHYINPFIDDGNNQAYGAFRMFMGQDENDGEFNYDEGNRNDDLFLIENDDIGEIPNNEEENENDNGPENLDQTENQPNALLPEPNVENNEEANVQTPAEANPINNGAGQLQNQLLNQLAEAGMPIQNADLNEQDYEAISRIVNYGYDPALVLQVYLACDKDEETTTACLMSM